MRLAISNIAWTSEYNEDIYELMKQNTFSGVEIAPTRVFADTPYDKQDEAKIWSKNLGRTYGFTIPSMQSIWFGKTERLFGSSMERTILFDYTKKAIDFAHIIGCRNLVFGCPANRFLEEKDNQENAVIFFKKLGDYAYQHGTVIGMEAVPCIYGTNYINTTASALELIYQVDSKGFMLNLDIGTMIQNDEEISVLKNCIKYISHVHISEPYLKKIKERPLHIQLHEFLQKEGYDGFVSIEMGKGYSLQEIGETMKYVSDLFGKNEQGEDNII